MWKTVAFSLYLVPIYRMLVTAHQIESSQEQVEGYFSSAPKQFDCKKEMKDAMAKRGFVNFFKLSSHQLESAPTGRKYHKDDVYVKGVFYYTREGASQETRVFLVESIIGERGYYIPQTNVPL